MPPSSSHLLLLLPLTTLVLFTPSSWAQNLTIGISLTAADNSVPWRSPSGDFAFGFQKLQGNTDLFLLSIWFDNIPDKTIVWYARGIDPVPPGSTLELTSNGLVLRNPRRQLIYRTNVVDLDRVASGFMNDTGNLQLLAADSSVVWESFRNPSDTILPTQTIELDEALISRKTETNFSLGRFHATMNRDGNFLFNTKSVPSNTDFDDEYYSSSTSDANDSNSGNRVVFSDRALIYVQRRNGQQQILSSSSIPPPSENYYRASLDFDGVFTLYYHPRNSGSNQSWSAAGSLPENICSSIDGGKGSGACGYNSVCRLENQRPVCNCPVGFSLDDPNNRYGDCKPNSVQSCIRGEKGDEYDVLEILDTDWPLNDYEQISPSSEQVCRSECLNDCLCAVAIYRSESCWKKKLPLSNGRVDTSLNAKAFLKFRKVDIPYVTPNVPTPSNPQKTLVLVLSVLLGSSAFVNFLLISAALLVVFLVYNKKLPISNVVCNTSGSNLRCFSYKELVQATNGFKEELGRGAFGIVYKGVMLVPDGSNTIVAVKKLDQVAHDSEKEFRMEVNVIGQTHHKNLVRLVGFCDEGPHRLLVYEYMCNGTLAGFLFADQKPSWKERTQIAFGIARGLTYLHEECSTQIIHCDIKPQNILLDEYHNARISDFGLAKLLMMNQSKTMTNIRGTKGYVAPEWFRNTQITAKVDVYSFGVVLLEIITCRKSLEDFNFEDGENPILTDWVWDCFCEGRVDSLVRMDEESLSDGKMVERFVKVGIWCIQEDASLRPTMRKACQMLEGIVEVGVPPRPFAFFSSV
ncbi:hypothetical protein ACS0TY_005309 [Phlomoides rotata]